MIVFAGFNIAFFSQFIMGSQGMPRRYYTYPGQFQMLHEVSSFGAFLLGVLTTRANQPGAIAGIGVSLVSMLLVKLYTPLAWTWYVLVGTAICVTVGYAVSLAVPTARRPVER